MNTCGGNFIVNECVCDKPGFCKLFNKEMTENPPNWQWCKGATKEERERHKEQSEKGFISNYPKLNGQIITNERLIKDTIQLLIPKLCEHKLSTIIGLPRSGLIPASLCSTLLNLPLYSLSSNAIIPLNNLSNYGGSRMSRYSPVNTEEGKIAIIDDTVWSGLAMSEIKRTLIAQKYDISKFIFSSVYSTEKGKENVDFYGKILNYPHILEWNFFNSSFVSNSLFDFDGVFSPDVPVELCTSSCDAGYIDYITNVKPFYHRLPKLFNCKGIVTGRLEKYRDITEAWLEKYKVKYKNLTMFPTERAEQRDSNHIYEVSKYKAEQLSISDAKFFVESSQYESRLISEFSHKTVLSINTGEFF